MGLWKVRLEDHPELEIVKSFLEGTEYEIVEDKEGDIDAIYLVVPSSMHAYDRDHAKLIYDESLRQIDAINGGISLAKTGNWLPLKVGVQVDFCEGESKSTNVFIQESLKVHSSLGVLTITVDGVEHKLPTFHSDVPLQAFSSQNPDAIELLGRYDKATNFVELYKLWEFARKKTGGEKKLIKDFGISKKEKDRFTMTCQLDRHDKSPSPSQEMNFQEAKGFLGFIIMLYLEKNIL